MRISHVHTCVLALTLHTLAKTAELVVSDEEDSQTTPSLRITGKGRQRTPAKTLLANLIEKINRKEEGYKDTDATGIDVRTDIKRSSNYFLFCRPCGKELTCRDGGVLRDHLGSKAHLTSVQTFQVHAHDDKILPNMSATSVQEPRALVLQTMCSPSACR
jgi:hypothetical protein